MDIRRDAFVRPVYSLLTREPWQPVQVRVKAWVALNWWPLTRPPPTLVGLADVTLAARGVARAAVVGLGLFPRGVRFGRIAEPLADDRVVAVRVEVQAGDLCFGDLWVAGAAVLRRRLGVYPWVR